MSAPLTPVNFTVTEELKLDPVITMLAGKAELSKLFVFTLDTVGPMSRPLYVVPS